MAVAWLLVFFLIVTSILKTEKYVPSKCVRMSTDLYGVTPEDNSLHSPTLGIAVPSLNFASVGKGANHHVLNELYFFFAL
jgi:hypothetical protein